MEPVEGFVKARQLLAERFESSYKIGEAWITKVTEEASLHANDHQGLWKFANDLWTCEQTLKALKLTQEIGSQRKLFRIVDRLPYYLRNSWQAYQTKSVQTTMPQLWHSTQGLMWCGSPKRASESTI